MSLQFFGGGIRSSVGAVSSGCLRFAGHYLPFFAGQRCSLCLLDLRRCRSCLLQARQHQPRDVLNLGGDFGSEHGMLFFCMGMLMIFVMIGGVS